VLVINPVIFAEVSSGFKTFEEMEDLFPPEDFRREGIRTSRVARRVGRLWWSHLVVCCCSLSLWSPRR
jgi:hypothetical protein